jgi:hypothetical protein
MSAVNGVFGWTGTTTRPAELAGEYYGRHRASARVMFTLRRAFRTARHRRS